MKLSKEQKQELADKLTVPWGAVNLMCDGYKVSLRVERYTSLKYRVATYVNGYIKGAWFSSTTNSPESKFLRKSVRPILSPTKRKEVEKVFGKRYVKNDPFWSGSVTVYQPDWASGKAAISHLCKVCESVQLFDSENALTTLISGVEA